MHSELEARRQSIDAQVASHIANLRKEASALEQKLKEEQLAAQRAAAMGDRSENAEWQIANDNIARYTVAAVSLLNTLDTYDRYTAAYAPSGKVMIGSTLKVVDKLHNATLYVKIFPVGLGNAKIGAITPATPLGAAVMGKAAGVEVLVKAPLGDIPYYIEEVL